MSVTTQIQGKGQAIFMNNDIVKRVQNVDLGADLAVENIEELANASYVEKLEDLPKVSISIETNDVGSMANLVMLKSGTQLVGVNRDATGIYMGTYYKPGLVDRIDAAASLTQTTNIDNDPAGYLIDRVYVNGVKQYDRLTPVTSGFTAAELDQTATNSVMVLTGGVTPTLHDVIDIHYHAVVADTSTAVLGVVTTALDNDPAIYTVDQVYVDGVKQFDRLEAVTGGFTAATLSTAATAVLTCTGGTPLAGSEVVVVITTTSVAVTETVTMADPTFDLDHQRCPSFVFKVSEPNTTVLTRSCHMQGAYLDSIEFSYEVGGLAKESYRFSGDHKVWYLGTKKDIDIDFATFATTATATTNAIATGNTLVAVFLNKEEVKNVAKSVDTYGITWAGNILTAASGTPFLAGDRIEIVYYVNTPRAFPKLTSTNTGTRGGLRRGCIKVYAWQHGFAGEKERLLRCQSVSGSLDFGRQEIYELGTQRYIDKPTTYPLNVRFDMTFNQADLKTMAIAQGKNAAGEFAALTSMDVKDFIDNCDVQIEVYTDAYTASATTLAKTITLSNCKVVTEGDTARVGNSAGQWRATLQTDNITWVSSGNALDV